MKETIIIFLFCLAVILIFAIINYKYRNAELTDDLKREQTFSESLTLMIQKQSETLELLIRQNDTLNNEIARLHGRKTTGSYVVDLDGENVNLSK